jgi:hypothetical protein
LLVLTVVPAMLGMWSTPVLAGGCNNEQLRIEDHSTELPDCRAYELVSTPYKDGYPLAHIGEIAPDGERMLLQSLGGVAGVEGGFSIEGSVYESVRADRSGWSVRAINPPASVYPLIALTDHSPGLERTLWTGRTASQSADADGLFVREPDGSIVSVGPMLPPSATSASPGGTQEPHAEAENLLKYRGASADLSHVFFIIRPEVGNPGEVSNAWKGDTTLAHGGRGFSLYEYSGLNNTEPKLVGIRNEGRLENNPDAEMITQCGTELGFGEEGFGNDVYNAISETGNTVFFTANRGGCENEVGEVGTGPPAREVYARVNEEKTVHISEPSHKDCEECDTSSPTEARFAGASHDGSKVFFMSEQPGLLPGAAGMNLYEYDLDASNEGHKGHSLVRVSEVASKPAAESKMVGVVRVSEDGSQVYFVAEGKLVNNKNEYEAEAAEGADNLYVYDTVTGSTTFIAQLSPTDGEDWQTGDGHPAQASLNGEVLIFASSALLTPDDQSSVVQLFEYNAGTGELVRVSVGHKEPTEPGGYFCPGTNTFEEGYNCDGNTENTNLAPLLGAPQYRAIDYSNLRTGAGGTLEISSTGTTAIFSSKDALAPQATNSLSSEPCRDVYEYRWNNDGTPGALGKGNVFLVSDGQDLGKSNSIVVSEECGSPSEAMMDESGKDILTESSRQLVSQDTNSQVDTYDAREGGGFAGVVSRPDCGGDGCQGSLSVSPSLLAAGSASQAGGGNLALLAPKPAVKRKTKPLTRAQKLVRALSACRKDANRRKERALCESQARGRYGGRPKARKGSVGGGLHGAIRGGSK